MTSRLLVSLVTAACAVFALSVSAETRTFQFSGTVNYGSPMAVLPGTQVVGTFSYDTDTAPASPLDFVVTYLIPAPHAFTATVGPHTISAGSLNIGIINNTDGNAADALQILGQSPVLDGTTFPEGAFGLFLASGPKDKNAVQSTSLPRRIDVKRFLQEPSVTYGTLQMDGSQTGTLLQFSIDSITLIDVKK